MIDKYTEERAKLLHPKVRQDVIDIATELAAKGLMFRITQGFRSFADQDKIYAQGRTAPGPIVTNAKGGQSNHCYGLAIDFCIDTPDGKGITFDMNTDFDHDGNKDFMEIINAFGAKGWQSGLFWKFKDSDHLEKTFGYSFQQLQALVDAGKVDSEGYVLI